ncbi:MAG: thioredoxin-dependent thiol peroxidase [Spirochaetales bacterium]|nr:thioredoxin-dependent thiol peroxidase [Spirochaetales bacterium]
MLKTGDKAPDFTLQNQDDETVKLSDFIGKKVLIYFYPKANTPGCTTQSCSVQESLPALETAGTLALGISPDSPVKQAKFAEKYGLKFPLLCDEEHRVAGEYGVWAEKKNFGKVYMGIVRSSFLIDENGVVLGAWYKVSPGDTVPKAMDALKGK